MVTSIAAMPAGSDRYRERYKRRPWGDQNMRLARGNPLQMEVVAGKIIDLNWGFSASLVDYRRVLQLLHTYTRHKLNEVCPDILRSSVGFDGFQVWSKGRKASEIWAEVAGTWCRNCRMVAGTTAIVHVPIWMNYDAKLQYSHIGGVILNPRVFVVSFYDFLCAVFK